MKTDRILTDIYNILQASSIPCTLNKTSVTETTFNTYVVNIFSKNSKKFIYFYKPCSLDFNICANLLKDYIRVDLNTEIRVIGDDKAYVTIATSYCQNWHHLYSLYEEVFKPKVESINSCISNSKFTEKSLEYLQANKKMLKQDYIMLQNIYSL